MGKDALLIWGFQDRMGLKVAQDGSFQRLGEPYASLNLFD
jgi:hypothetical protein